MGDETKRRSSLLRQQQQQQCDTACATQQAHLGGSEDQNPQTQSARPHADQGIHTVVAVAVCSRALAILSFERQDFHKVDIFELSVRSHLPPAGRTTRLPSPLPGAQLLNYIRTSYSVFLSNKSFPQK